MAVWFGVRIGLFATAATAIALLSAPHRAWADPIGGCNGSGVIADTNSEAVISTNGQLHCVYLYDSTTTLSGYVNPAVPEGEPTTSSYHYDTVYDDRIDSRTDTGGIVTQYQYDPVRPSLLESTSGGQTTQYQYDNQGLESATDPSRTTQFQYDALDRVTLVTDLPASDMIDTNFDPTSSIYDPSGDVIETLDRNGDISSYHYDAQDRLIEVDTTIPGMPPIELKTQFFYDSQNRVTSMTDAAGTTTYTYDPISGLLDSVTDPSNNVTSFTYDNGLLVSETDPATDVQLVYTADIPEPTSAVILISALTMLAGWRHARRGAVTSTRHR